jgi:hypothetical protein
LRNQGYQIERMLSTMIINEIISKTLADAGGKNMPLSHDDIRDLLHQFFDELAEHGGADNVHLMLQALPQISRRSSRGNQ